MPRIRTIKPEFPQSETVGKLSREARLLFIMLWTISDDEGRLRASSRMLASLLYPYDDDARDLIDVWLDELEREQCVARYVVDGSTYLVILNWLKHQKIDKPTKSRFPAPDEHSRALAKPREASTTDLGPRTKDQDQEGKGKDRGGGVDTRAREPEPPKPASKSLISEGAFSLSKDVLKAMGRDEDDPICVGAPLTIQSWLNAGWNGECILIGVKRGMQSRNGEAPSTLKYFEKAIARAHAELTAPVPKAELREAVTFQADRPRAPRPLTPFQQAQKDTHAILRMLDEPDAEGGRETTARLLRADHGERSDGLHGGTGGPVLALPVASADEGD